MSSPWIRSRFNIALRLFTKCFNSGFVGRSINARHVRVCGSYTHRDAYGRKSGQRERAQHISSSDGHCRAGIREHKSSQKTQ